MNKLLSRKKFQENVFKRDKYICVFCDKDAVDAHHIIERRLWHDSGYYLNNGASVCESHHLDCEMTKISVEDIRIKCGIEKPIIPPHLYKDEIYDKWGNIILSNGLRLKGELFFDDGVQKILREGNKLSLFTDYIKYPRTYHLPWSVGMTDDDRMIQNIDIFKNRRVIVTEKLDGENTTLYNDYIHARSIDSKRHESRDWLKNFWSKFNYNIPKGFRICGENMYAKHSIEYKSLISYFYGFSIWNDKNECLSWDETLEWFKLIHNQIKHVPIIYDGIFKENLIIDLWDDYDKSEGYVIRIADKFTMRNFKYKVAKYVRKNHVNTITHWMNEKRIIKNELKI